MSDDGDNYHVSGGISGDYGSRESAKSVFLDHYAVVESTSRSQGIERKVSVALHDSHSPDRIPSHEPLQKVEHFKESLKQLVALRSRSVCQLHKQLDAVVLGCRD